MLKKGALAVLAAFLLLGSFLVTAKAQDNLPLAMVDCLKSSLGKDRFQEIYERHSQPTDEEIQQGVACFKQSGKTLSEVAFGSKFTLEIKQCLTLAIGSEKIQAIIK